MAGNSEKGPGLAVRIPRPVVGYGGSSALDFGAVVICR